MTTIFIQVFTLFIFVAIGYIMGKKRIVSVEHTGILSSLLVYVFLPCNVFGTFSSNFTPRYISANTELLYLSIGIILLMMLLAPFLAKPLSRDGYEKNVFKYSFIIPNFGYMGFALTEALLGESGLMNIMIFGLPSNIYIYTIGYALLTKQSMDPKKLINPVIIATVLGIAAGLCELSIPAAVDGIMDKATACVGPVSMLLTGIAVSEMPLKNLVNDRRVYLITAIRTVILPLLLWFGLKSFFDAGSVQIAALFYALPFGMNTVVFAKLVNEDCELGASLTLLSAVTSCLTLPIVLGIMGI